MNKIEQKERQEIYDQILNYHFFDQNGTLTLEPFCVHLAYYLNIDGFREKSPEPASIYYLLLDLIKEFYGADNQKRYVTKQRVLNWTPEMSVFYPEKTATLIHFGGLVQVSHHWIYDIGHKLLGLPEPENAIKYFDWIDEKWINTFAFINGYHNAFHLLQKEFDRKQMRENGYSMFEALHLSMKKNIDFEEAITELKQRHNSYQAALAQIDNAILDNYFLESITLQECLISHCFFNFLENKGVKLKEPTFNTLIKNIISFEGASKAQTDLFEKVDVWRKNRNTSIHGYFTSDNHKFNKSRLDFQSLSSSTAKQGMELSRAIVEWYEFECVNFIQHEFPSKGNTSLH